MGEHGAVLYVIHYIALWRRNGLLPACAPMPSVFHIYTSWDARNGIAVAWSIWDLKGPILPGPGPERTASAPGPSRLLLSGARPGRFFESMLLRCSLFCHALGEALSIAAFSGLLKK